MTYNLDEVIVVTRIKQLRKIFGYTQDKLAKLLCVSRSTVAMWETSTQTPDYKKKKKIEQIFDAPTDFILSTGIFEKWDDIIKYYDSVCEELFKYIPRTLFLPTFSEEKTLCAWLDTRLYFEQDELQLARWFAFAVKEIAIYPIDDDQNHRLAEVDLSLTNEMNAIIAVHTKDKNNTAKPCVAVPVLGDVAAGIPIEAITDIVDYEEIDAAMASSGEHFGLRIKGSSMEPRMMEGDVVIVRKQDTAETGDTVVVLVNGDSATVKKIKYGSDGISLIPTNPAHDVQFYSAADVERLPVRVIGKVVELRAKY